MGPLQLLLFGFPEAKGTGSIMRELQAVRQAGLIRLVDLQGVSKDSAGNIKEMELSDLTSEQRMRLGAVIGGLIGFGAGGKEGARMGAEAGAQRVAEHTYGLDRPAIRTMLDDMPRNSAAVLALIEHRWAENLSNAVRQSGGQLLAQGMIEPEALVGLGEAMKETMAATEEMPMPAR